MQFGTLIPQTDIGGSPGAVKEFALAAEAAGYDYLEAADHVLGANVANRPIGATATRRPTCFMTRSCCSATSPRSPGSASRPAC